MVAGEQDGLLRVETYQELPTIRSETNIFKRWRASWRTAVLLVLSLLLAASLAVGIFVWERSHDVCGASSSPIAGIFYINVNASSPRGVTLDRHLHEKSCGVPYKRFQALTPADLPDIDIKHWSNGIVARRVLRLPEKPRSGTIACYLSHAALANHLMQWKSQDRPYLVLEDDARLDVSWQDRIEQAMDALPPDWDVLKVGWGGHHRRTDSVNDQLFKARGPFWEHNKYFYLGAQGYLLRPQSIPAYMACLRAHIIDDIDKIMVEADCMKTYVAANKAVHTHKGFPSERTQIWR